MARASNATAALRRLTLLGVAAALCGCDAQGWLRGSADDPAPATGSQRGPARRLNPVELTRALEAAFPGVELPPVDLPPDPVPARFDNAIEAAQPSGLFFAAHRRLALRASAAVVEQARPCVDERDGPAADACARAFIAGAAEQLFRRPLTAQQRAAYLAPLDAYRDEAPSERLRLTLELVLLAPELLYRAPRADAEGALDAFALATRLSFFLWESPPDAALRAAAAGGALAEPEGLARHVERMLDDPRAEATFVRFMSQWLDVGALDRTSSLSDDLRASLHAASRAFLVHGLWRADANLGALFTTDRAWLDDRLADRIGVRRPDAPLQEVRLDPDRRGGWLTRPTFLTTHALPDKPSPVQRGVFVFDRLLCRPFPPPPPEAMSGAVVPDGARVNTNRDYYEVTTNRGPCAACHEGINGAGYAFENYDQFGRWRDADRGHPVDASAAIGDANFAGAAALSRWLATSPAVRDCLARHWLEFAAGDGSMAADDGLRVAVADALADQPLRRIPFVIATHSRFARLASPPEGAP